MKIRSEELYRNVIFTGLYRFIIFFQQVPEKGSLHRHILRLETIMQLACGNIPGYRKVASRVDFSQDDFPGGRQKLPMVSRQSYKSRCFSSREALASN